MQLFHQRVLFVFSLVIILPLLSGCGGDEIGRTVPVTGKVLVGDAPLTKGTVAFWPDESKGNQSKFEAVGEIGTDGNFTLYTRGKPGAPTGWYKVTVVASSEPDPNAPYAPPKLVVNPNFVTKEKTSLKAEVVENPAPDAYTFKLPKS